MTDTLFQSLALWPEGLSQGQLWRLWTAHLAHVSWQHLMGNLTALLALMILGDRRFSPGEYFALIVIAPLLISLVILWTRPELAWYAGASGITHLLLARQCYLLAPRWASLALGLLLAKLWLETQTTSLWTSHAELVHEAHRAGVVLGLLFGRWRPGASKQVTSRRRSAVMVYCAHARSQAHGTTPQDSDGFDARFTSPLAQRLWRRHGQRQPCPALRAAELK
ncbi:MAG: rhombosortase [Wenzhouxiangella sp.]